jgi:hypothetical protein
MNTFEAICIGTIKILKIVIKIVILDGSLQWFACPLVIGASGLPVLLVLCAIAAIGIGIVRMTPGGASPSSPDALASSSPGTLRARRRRYFTLYSIKGRNICCGS